ncbi:MAG: hypothetical protein AAFN92_21015, partial [Bacteroidota bacterium]
VDFGNAELDEALTLTEPADLEDGYQVVLAQKCGAEVFITNDHKLLRVKSIKMQTTAQFLSSFEYT